MTACVHPAERYEPCADLWTITCIFNPSGWRSKLDNYHRFARPFREGGLPLVTVECAIGDAGFALPPGPDVVHVRSRSTLWHKERLLNIALARLPPQARKVAWVDGDVLFANPRWAVDASGRLDRLSVLQPFETWHRLPRGHDHFSGEGESGISFAHRVAADPRFAWQKKHGLTGYAWAARRDLLDRHGFYDGCIIGGGDHAMAHAFNGSLEAAGVQRITGLVPHGERRWRRWGRRLGHALLRPRPTPFASHLRGWAAAMHADLRGPIGCVPGTLLHLWHGSKGDRRYKARHGELRRLAYDPSADVWRNDDGAWEWHPRRDDLRRWAEGYFESRAEDG